MHHHSILRKAFVVLAVSGALSAGIVFAGNLLQLHNMPPTLPPPEYGNTVLNRIAEKNDQKAVVFPHWSHRAKYTCRVCHLELEFSMEAGETQITEKAIRAGRFCGNCHNGKIAFAPKGPKGKNCSRCHRGKKKSATRKFKAFARKLPSARYGNRINWVKALRTGRIKPKNSMTASNPLIDERLIMKLDRTLELRAEMALISPAIFPHKAHTEWLECSQCHPDIFNIKKKTTERFSMDKNLDGQFCGVCHLTIAFPMNDCKRCHPRMREIR